MSPSARTAAPVRTVRPSARSSVQPVLRGLNAPREAASQSCVELDTAGIEARGVTSSVVTATRVEEEP
jgi:hypothetical protein